MRLSEFIGGFITAISILFISLAIIFLDKIFPGIGGSSDSQGKLYLELITPYAAGIIAGIGIGFGIKSEEGGMSLSFSFDFSEQWPVLIGAISLAGVFGTAGLLYLSQTPVESLFLTVIGALLATFGLIIVIASWETGY
ncbi:MAG: hypothetical protein ACFFD1_04285 [Candidatus Thorarchaeota archaeon]